MGWPRRALEDAQANRVVEYGLSLLPLQEVQGAVPIRETDERAFMAMHLRWLILFAGVISFFAGAAWPEPPGPWEMLHRSRVASGDLSGMRRESCLSTVFGYEGDTLAGGNAILLGRPINAADRGIAHRLAPIGSYARVCLEKRCAWAQVVTRGPYGCVAEPRPDQTCRGPWRENRRWCICAGAYRAPESAYRGCADLTPALAEELGHDGLERIEVLTERKR